MWYTGCRDMAAAAVAVSHILTAGSAMSAHPVYLSAHFDSCRERSLKCLEIEAFLRRRTELSDLYLDRMRPSFPFRPVYLCDKERICATQGGTELSSRCFLSLYAYAQEDDILLLQDDQSGCLLLLAIDGENRLCAYPPVGCADGGGFARAVRGLEEAFALAGQPLRFCNVAEAELARFYALADYRVLVSASPDDTDYVYDASELTRFDGHENYNRRMNANRFRRKHAAETLPLREEHFDDCMKVIRGWCGARSCSACGYRCPMRTAQRVLGRMEEIGAVGAIMYVDGEPGALTLLGDMGGGMFDLLSIFTSKRLTGLTYCLLDDMCRLAAPGAKTINFEEDMGIESLRHFKRSLRPSRMVEKYEARLLRK